MSSVISQLFYLTQLVQPDDMNTMYNDIGQKINAYFPRTPSIMNGLKYTQTGTSNVISVQTGSVRWKDQINALSPEPQFTWSIIDSITNLSITCPTSVAQKYIVAKVTKTALDDTFISISGQILTTAYTLAEIAAFATPNEYAPLWTITNNAGVYTIGTDSNCATNYGKVVEGSFLPVNTTSIPSNANLNNYTTTGIYYQGSNADASSGTNYPAPLAGSLEVFSLGAMIYQRYTVYACDTVTNNNYDVMYLRCYYSTGWSPWKKQANLNDNQNFAGLNNFTVSPTVPTVAVTDNSLKAANTAYVNAMFSSFTQPSPNSITRTYLSKNRDIISVADFGASPSATAQQNNVAFYNASQYIQSIGGGTLIIPAGTYAIGYQASGAVSGQPYYRPTPMITITGCANPVRIVGNGAYLKIANGLHFGSFDNTTGLPTGGINTDPLKRADIGVVIGGYNNASFVVENLIIDGNSPNAVIGGQWGDTGYQCTAYGVQVANNIITDIANVKTINHCLDGIAVGNTTTAATPIMPVKLSNIISDGNARQGCSWTGGNSLLAENCIFSNTGKTVNIGTGVALLSSPAAGFDIEAEGGCIIRNGTFINCIYGNNGGAGLVADSGDSADCTFISNKFYGTTNTSLYPKKPRFLFIKCLIAGQSTSSYTATNPSDRTTFYSCIFSGQESYNGIAASYGVALADYTSQNPVFYNCSFITTNPSLRLIISTVGAQYNSCYFYQNGSSGAAFSKGTFIGNNQMIVETGSCDLSGSVFIDSLQYSGAVTSNGVDTVGGLTSSTGDTEAYKKLILRSNNGAAWGNQPISSFYIPPTSGAHERGEIIINSSPSAGAYFGWVCVTSGTPGTWQTFGQISLAQTWQDVTTSRTSGVTYTNTTTQPIMVGINGTSNGLANSNISPIVGSQSLPGVASAINTQSISVYYVVPPGSTYRAILTNVVLVQWVELR